MVRDGCQNGLELLKGNLLVLLVDRSDVSVLLGWLADYHMDLIIDILSSDDSGRNLLRDLRCADAKVTLFLIHLNVLLSYILVLLPHLSFAADLPG